MKDSNEGVASPHAGTVIPPTNPSDSAAHPGQAFTIRIRGLHQRESDACLIHGDTVEQAAFAAIAFDVSALTEPVFSWFRKSELVALDIDRAEGAAALTDEEVPALFPEWSPQPLAAWATHGGGLRVLFRQVDGHSALALAGAWHILAPLGRIARWTVQPKCDSRHPKGMRGIEQCGQVFTFAASSNFRFPSEPIAIDVTSEHVQVWLAEHGRSLGRHGPEACPSCGHRSGTCNPCVVIDERGLRCYRCGTFCSWPSLLSDRSGLGKLEAAARNLVHWPHQRFVLSNLRATTPEELQRPAWAMMLRCANQDRLANDPNHQWVQRITRASSDTMDIVRSSTGCWLSARTLEPRRVSADRTLRELPSAFTGTRIDQALSAEVLEGFVPIHVIDASVLLAPGDASPGIVQVRRPPRPGEPPAPDVGSEPPTRERVEHAWATLGEDLVGLNRGYLTALVTATLIAQRGVSTPPMIVVTGLPGASKTATVHLAAGMVGTRVGDINLSDSDDVSRQVGLCLEAGCSPLLFDEVGRVRGIYERLQPILRLNTKASYRPKYQNERTVTVNAPVVLVGSTLPRAIVASPELGRRAVGFVLSDTAVHWEKHGDVSGLRNDPKMRSVLDVITADIWWRVSAGEVTT